jgi:uncharacterized membrane protein YoaK (UPF0700 family)
MSGSDVTGNFVTFGAALVNGTSGAFAKLLALPVFCAVVLVTRIFSFSLPSMGLPIFRTMLTIKLLLVLGAALAVHFGPFTEGDAWQAVVTGMVLVSAMSIQNARAPDPSRYGAADHVDDGNHNPDHDRCGRHPAARSRRSLRLRRRACAR